MTTDTQTRPADPIAIFRASLDKMSEQFKSALPQHITVQKFIRTLMTAVQINPDLLDADRRTLFSAAMRAAQMGLLPDGREGAVTWFMNRRAGVKQCQFMPMFAGLLKLIRNSGELATIDAQLVYSKDKFTYHPGIDLVPVHEPDWFGDRGEPIGVYAVAKMKDGSAYVEIMNRKQIDQIRNVSRSADSGPWKDWWEEMWRKSVIRRLAKRLPLSTDLDTVLHEDDDLFMPEPAPAATDEQPAAPAPKARASRLQAVADQAPPPAPALIEDEPAYLDEPAGDDECPI